MTKSVLSILQSFVSTIFSMLVNLLIMRVIGLCLTLCRLHFFAKRTLSKQGISGPPPSWITGNAAELRDLAIKACSEDMPRMSHDLLPRLHPAEHKFSSKYGKRYLTWTVGWEPAVNIAEPDLIQEILASPDFDKSGIQNRYMSPIFGKGLPVALGKEWENQRKVMTPAFHSEKIKQVQEIAKSCAHELVESWSRLIKKDCNELDVHSEFASFSAEVIARAMFGNSFQRKEEYIHLERELVDLVFKQSVFRLIPGYSYLPTPENRKIGDVNKKLHNCVKKLIQSRLSEAANDPDLLGNDMLGLFLSAVTTKKRKSLKLNVSKELLIDECKSLFFAGHETTANLLTWCTMLLALHPEWQTKARDEIRQNLQPGELDPTPQLLSKLKTVGAIISETLRLYPSVVRMRRKALKDVKLGNDKLLVPNGVSVDLSILSVHHDGEIWGEDVLEFKPERFLDRNGHAAGTYLPFGAGPRLCIGRSFALTEASTLLCMLLQRFHWKMSPAYRHAPQAAVTVYPKHGMQIILSFCDA